MRSLTRNTFRFAGALLLVSLLAIADRSAGQDPEDAQLISLNFPGGTAVAYVNAVRKAAGDINVVIDPEAGEVVMPSVTVKQVTVASAIDLLDGRVRDMPGRRIQLDVAHLTGYDTRERPTYQVRAKVGGRTTAQVASVWTVAALLDHDYASDAVLSAVETALEVVSSPTRPDVRFHEDTALLIASGDHDQLQAIEQVLDRLQEAVNTRRQDEMRRVEMQLQELRQGRENAINQLHETEDEVKNARQDVLAMRQETARLEMMTAELERMLTMKEQELADAMAQVRALQLELQKERARGESVRRQPGD